MGQTTHRTDDDGCIVQIVSPHGLRVVLDVDGDDYSRPNDWGDDDEWDVDSDLPHRILSLDGRIL